MRFLWIALLWQTQLQKTKAISERKLKRVNSERGSISQPEFETIDGSVFMPIQSKNKQELEYLFSTQAMKRRSGSSSSVWHELYIDAEPNTNRGMQLVVV
jgi:hypothetical protein